MAKSNLQGFLSKFNSSEGKWIDTIDPLHTFDVKFTFFPFIEAQKVKKGPFDKMVDKAASAGASMLKNATGGLIGTFMNDVDILKLRDDFEKSDKFGKTTQLEYISRGNLLTGGGLLGGAGEDIADKLVLDLSYYVQNITLPSFQTSEGGTSETIIGKFPINGKYATLAQNTIQMAVINTKSPLLEKIFYPWMREITLPYWSYDDQPYTTANIKISMTKHADVSYTFVGCRPSQIEPYTPSQSLADPTRNVTFVFDYGFINSHLKAADAIGSWEDAGKAAESLGKNLLGNAGNMIGL